MKSDHPAFRAIIKPQPLEQIRHDPLVFGTMAFFEMRGKAIREAKGNIAAIWPTPNR